MFMQSQLHLIGRMMEATCSYYLVANRLDVMSLTLQQRTNHSGWPKAGEMIEMSGTHPLQASDRALLNAIYQFAHTADAWKIRLRNGRYRWRSCGRECTRATTAS